MANFELFSYRDIKSIMGNFSFVSQLPAGGLALSDGICSAIDATTCVNPMAKPLFVTGAALGIASGASMLCAFGAGFVCPLAVFPLGITGWALRKGGRYAVSGANSIEPKPTLTKISGPLTTIGENIFSLEYFYM